MVIAFTAKLQCRTREIPFVTINSADMYLTAFFSVTGIHSLCCKNRWTGQRVTYEGNVVLCGLGGNFKSC